MPKAKHFKDPHVNMKNLDLEIPLFLAYQKPNGFLCPERQCHGLFYYFLVASNARERELDGIVLEGQEDPKTNYRQLFTTIANLYGSSPENMNNHWQCVDMQALALKLPKMNDPVVRQDKTPELKSH